MLLWCVLGAALPGTFAGATIPLAVDGEPLPSLAPMLERVLPSVENIYTEGRVRQSQSQSPFQSDPFFEKFFGGPPPSPVNGGSALWARGSSLMPIWVM
jgi:serine protease Do/serine protease DegQ